MTQINFSNDSGTKARDTDTTRACSSVRIDKQTTSNTANYICYACVFFSSNTKQPNEQATLDFSPLGLAKTGVTIF
jgi:hypothetical protein